jgi:hypothetical protein
VSTIDGHDGLELLDQGQCLTLGRLGRLDREVTVLHPLLDHTDGVGTMGLRVDTHVTDQCTDVTTQRLECVCSLLLTDLYLPLVQYDLGYHLLLSGAEVLSQPVLTCHDPFTDVEEDVTRL